MVVKNPSGKIASAMNAAIKAARYDVITRIDGHAMLPDGYLATAVRTLLETGAADVGGVMAAEGVTPFQRAVAWCMTSPVGMGAAANHTGGQAGPADTVYLGVYRRDAIERVGGYDETMIVAEDWELNYRIRAAGGLIWFTPELQVTYRPRATLYTLATSTSGTAGGGGSSPAGTPRPSTGATSPRPRPPRPTSSGRCRGHRRGGDRGAVAPGRSVPDSGVCHSGGVPGRGHRGGGAAGAGPAAGRAGAGAGRARHDAHDLGAGVLDQPAQVRPAEAA